MAAVFHMKQVLRSSSAPPHLLLLAHALGVRELQTHIGGRPARLALQGIQFGRGDAAVPRSFLTTTLAHERNEPDLMV
jgi:hypothetical protein